MTPVVLTLAALAGFVCWLCASPVRLAFAAGALLVTHPAPTQALTALAAAGLTVAGGVLLYQSLRDGGWHLVTVCRPNLAAALAPVTNPAPVGGGAR